jgi:hypothetical protein
MKGEDISSYTSKRINWISADSNDYVEDLIQQATSSFPLDQ